jgi:hypothetical protein
MRAFVSGTNVGRWLSGVEALHGHHQLGEFFQSRRAISSVVRSRIASLCSIAVSQNFLISFALADVVLTTVGDDLRDQVRPSARASSKLPLERLRIIGERAQYDDAPKTTPDPESRDTRGSTAGEFVQSRADFHDLLVEHGLRDLVTAGAGRGVIVVVFRGSRSGAATAASTRIGATRNRRCESCR